MRRGKKIQWAVGALIGIFAGAVILAGFSARGAISEFQAAKQAVARGQSALQGAHDLSMAADFFEEAVQHLRAGDRRIARAPYLGWVPWVALQVKAVRIMSASGQAAASGTAEALRIVADLYVPFKERADLRLGDVSIAEREELLRRMALALPLLQGVQQKMENSVSALSVISREGLVPELAEGLQDLSTRVQYGVEFLRDGLPLLKVAPALLGYPHPRTYLFILENSDELRPTGGFIGTYGILKMEAGHPTKFFTDDVYNLDRHSHKNSRPYAPEPLAQYLEQRRWFLRDANWAPDFPTSARTILQFYEEESARACRGNFDVVLQDLCATRDTRLDGVIAITPSAITPLLKLTGPLTVQGQIFGADNLASALEYEVEINFAQKGIPRPQRKEIISELGYALIARLLTLPAVQWPVALQAVREALDERQILVYSKDEAAQVNFARAGWTGELVQSDDDYLAVFDANLFALKTDPFVSRSIFYAVRQEESRGLVGEVELVYNYPKSGPAWKTKGYRSWTRVYVPKGSVLISAQGAMEEENNPKPGRVQIGQEFGKTFFGVFFAVQAGGSHRLRFMYRLPENIGAGLSAGHYALLVQKQPGTLGHSLTVSADFDKVSAYWSPRGLNARRDGSQLVWQNNLRTDQEFKVGF